MHLSLSKAAHMLGIDKGTLSKAVKGGRLTAERRVDGSFGIDVAELERFRGVYGHRFATAKANGSVDMDDLLDTYVALYRHKLRQVPEAPGHMKWFVRADDGHWRRDATLRARWYARLVCRETSQRVSRETGNEALARRIATAATVSKLEQLARRDPRLIGALPTRSTSPLLA